MADSVDSSLMDEDSTDSSESSSAMKSPAKRTLARRTVMTRQSSCRRQAHRGRRNSHSQKNNLLHKLHLRQMFGKIQATSVSEEAKVFSRLPGRLAFFIRDAVPHSALTSGHVFLGFSRCGQFLLSYTQTNTENEQFDLSFNYYYRLHWWLFVPYAKARKVAEVTLFTNQGVYGNLHISFCQWPGDMARVVVYGYEVTESDTASADPADIQEQPLGGSLHCYMTVTAVPSLNNCKACVKVASSYDENDLAENWNSCVRLSCLKHGMTVHTQFDLVAPYPKFEPKISLKRDNCVVVNTGNFLHSVTVDMEQLTGGQEEGEDEHHLEYQLHHRIPHHLGPLSPPLQPISVNVGMAEFSLGSLGSPSGFSPASFNPASDSETDGEGEAAVSSRGKRQTAQSRISPRANRSFDERREKASEFAAMLSGSPVKKPKYSPFKKLCIQDLEESDSFEFAVPSTSKDRKKKMADAAYDMSDESFDVSKPEKLSTFRKKRLAEKKYEFTEDDEFTEKEETPSNFKPLTRLRSKKIAAEQAAEMASPPSTSTDLSEVMKMEDGGEVMVCVSKGEDPESAQDDYWSDVMASTTYPELLSPGGCIKKDSAGHSSTCLSPRVSQPMSPQVSSMSPRGPGVEIFCTAKFSRCYVEVDDELISVITDVEDDDLGTSTGYHSALPLEVHGSGYTQMQMISNTKAEKLSLPCVRVQQRSLDLEQFCHETATRLCANADKKFWFCNDYDVEVVDLDPGTGDVTAVAVVLIQAAMLTKSRNQQYTMSSLHRMQYQASFRFCWNIDSGHYYIIDSDPLKEISGYKDPSSVWNPARIMGAPLTKKFLTHNNNIRVLTNESVIRGTSLKAIVDPDNLVALILND